MILRAHRDEDLPEVKMVMSQAFSFGHIHQGEPGKIDDEKSTSFGIYEDSGLQASLEINHYKIYMGNDVQLKMGGIGGVACMPASRGKGYAGEVLKHALKMMKEREEHASFLFPFSWDFYRKYGWDWTGVQRTYTVPTNILKSSPETEYVRAITAEDWKVIGSVYEAYSKQYRGMMIRSDKHWEDILKHEEKTLTFSYAYSRDEKIEGYFVLRGGKKEETHIRELITLTPRAYKGLLGLLKRHDMQMDKFSWAAPENDPLWSQLYHWDIETKLEPATSARVVDVAGAIAAWQPATPLKGKFTLKVQDEYAPWNTASWKVEVDDKQVNVVRSSENADISIDIQAFSQVYFGSPNADQLRSAGRLTVHDEVAYAVFLQLFSGPSMWINDHF